MMSDSESRATNRRESENSPAEEARAGNRVFEPGSIRDYLLYTLSLPERALRTTAGLAGGAVRESAALLVPQAFQDSKTYTVLVQQTLEFLVEDIGGVARDETTRTGPPKLDDFVARKTVGNFIEMASLATLHLSPMLLLAVVSDVAYGTQTYLNELAEDLKREGIIDEETTIDHAGDLLTAIGRASGAAATAFDTPPISIAGLKATIDQTQTAVRQIDPTQVLPRAEITRIWNQMRAIADREGISLLEVSGAMTLHSLDQVANVGRGALSTARAAGRLFDRHVVDHYRLALHDIQEKGFYGTLAESSGPYIEAVWKNFSTEKPTITEDLLSGQLVGKAARSVGRWLGLAD